MDTHNSASPVIAKGLINPDLRPISPGSRTWSSRTYLALWVGMAINAATWTLAASLIAMGMNWLQAIFTIVLANLIILVPMLFNSHAGAKHGITFPVFIRSSFGIRGSNIPALLRALVGCGWAGIQTWLTALALDLGVGALVGSAWTEAPKLSLGFVGEQRITLWACFLFCAVAQVWGDRKGIWSGETAPAICSTTHFSGADRLAGVPPGSLRGQSWAGGEPTKPSRLG